MPRPARPLVRVPVPPGAEGPARLMPALAAAMAGDGPAIAPVPTASVTTSTDYVATLLAAVRCDDPTLPLESDDVAVVMATSGSTGLPRGVLLTAEQLTAVTAAVHGPGATPQWIAALPVTSMGGLNVLVRALATGRDPVVVPSIGGAGPFTASAFAQAVAAASNGSADVRVALVPAQLSRLMADDAGIEALQQCSAVLVGGAAVRPSLLDNGRSLGIRLITTYGATETAGGCVYDGWPLPGVTVSSAGDPGPLTISGPCVALGYRGEPELTRRHFAAGAFRTPDLGIVGADGRVEVIGRIDDVVIIRGVNVSPTAVENAIADLPDIVATAVVSVAGPGDEPRLVAFVEVRDNAADAADAAREHVGRLLGPAARPIVRRIVRLPHLPNGKVDRPALQLLARQEDT